MEERERKLVMLQGRAGGVPAGIRTHLRPGRLEVTTAGYDPNLQLVGGDPYGTPDFTGLLVPTAPTPTGKPQLRYLFQLARIGFNNPESAWLRGIRLYASLFGYTITQGVTTGPFEKQITSPMWRFPDGNISWHVMVIGKTWRDRRNPANTDSLVFLDSSAPAQLFQVPASVLPPVAYVPPNAGRPWGKAIASDLGNIHDMRYPWRDDHAETVLNIPIPAPCDVAIFCSVAQHDFSVDTGVPAPVFTANQFAAATPEDQFWSAYSNVQYGRVAASLIIGQELGKEYEQLDEARPFEWRAHNDQEPR